VLIDPDSQAVAEIVMTPTSTTGSAPPLPDRRRAEARPRYDPPVHPGCARRDGNSQARYALALGREFEKSALMLRCHRASSTANFYSLAYVGDGRRMRVIKIIAKM
jgi:hypothetical protein